MEDSKHANTNFVVILEALLDAAGDNENVVRESVCKALQKLAKERTTEVVEKICLYKEKKGKMSTNHAIVLLNVLECVAQDYQNKFSNEIVSQLIGFSVDEMLKNENTQAIQSVLSSILIALGSNHCNEVLTALIPKLQPGCDPNPHLLMTLGHLSCANVTQCVPIIKVTFNIMIPMMPTTRNEQLRIALAFVIGKFCEALEEYMSVSEADRDSAVTAQTFSEEIISAYNVIANSWVQAKEVKVTESAICCLGPLFNLLPEEKAGLATSRAITCLLNAYRRPCIQHHLITSCLATVLSTAPPSAIIPVLDQVLHSLGNMVIVPPDYSLPQTVKQHSEVLRCYDHVGKHFTERLTDLLLKQMKMGNEKEKVESLIVTAHLISGSEKILESRMHEIIPAMANLLNDPSLKVKKALVKAIVALFCKRGQTDGPYHVANSNEAFIEFLVRHSVLNQTSNFPDCVELSNICTATIHLLSSTVDNLRPCLWNTLLTLLTNPAFDPAVPIVTKALAQIAPKTSPEEVVPKDGPNPSLETVLCRSFALLGSPLNNNRGPSILQFLQHFARYLSPHISDLWAHKLPQLINYLLISEWNEGEWDSLLLEVINSTVTTISCHDSNWPVEVSRRLTSLLATAQPGDEENVLLCSLAITTAVIEDKQHVAEDLETILLRFKAGSNIKVCARAVGILSSAHLEMVLGRLETIAQTELNRRNSRLLGLMKDLKVEAEIEKCREVLLECYAAIAQRCPLMELFPKLETLTQWILSQITIAKEGSCREAALDAIYNCGESLVRNKTNGGKHTLKNRTNILNIVLQLIQQNKPDPLSIRVITVFVKLPPPLIDTCRTHILKICFDRVLSQDPPNNGYDHATAMQTLKQLGELVEELLVEDIGPDRLDEVTTLLDPWVRHRNAQQRLSGITILRTALLAYYQNMKLGFQNPSTFNQSGDLIGTLVVRVFDSNEAVGKLSAHAAGIVLAITSVYEGHSHDPTIEKIFDVLPDENAASHIAQVLCSRLPNAQIHKLTARLLDGLTDCDQTACSNASDVLACVFTYKGSELFHYVNDILGSLLLQLFTSGNHPSNGVSAVIALAKHHPKLVMNILLKQSIPLHSSLCECWKLIASDTQLSAFALEHLLHIIQSSELYAEDNNKNSNRPKIAALQPLAAVCALSEMVDSELIADLLRGNLAQLLPSLMTSLAAYIGAKPPVVVPSPSKAIIITNRDAFRISPDRVVKDCLQRVLIAVGCDAGAKSLSSSSQVTHIDALVSVIPQLTVSICQTFPLLLPTLMTVLNQYAATNCEPQRIIITAFYAECLAVQCNNGGDASLVDSLVASLESAATAPDHTVRAIALRGLRYIAQLPQSEREKHMSSVLASLLEGLEDSTYSRVSLEAMLSLSTLIPSLNSDTLARIQLPLANRLKPFFEKEEIGLRSGSLRLFGQLYCKDREGQSGYREHMEGSLVCLLVHLSEPEPSVVKACKYSLREGGPVLNAKKVCAMFQDHLIDDGNLQYEQFVSVLVKSIVEELDYLALNMFTTCLTYMKSNWPAIRGNAALLAGLIYLNLNESMRNEISLDPVSTKLLLLATDSNPEVRAKAIQAMSLIFSA